MLYIPQAHEATPQPVVIKVGPREVTGRNLAHVNRTPIQRAMLAADIAKGDTVVVKPTLRQALMLTGASGSYAVAAKKLDTAEKRSIASGLRPLISRRVPTLPSNKMLMNMIRMVGVDRILDVAAEVERT
jgi:hypothetical protein